MCDSPANSIRLQEIDLFVTMRCDLQCDFCSVSANDFLCKELPLDRILGLIDEAHALGLEEIHFSGGEPTLRDDLEQMVAHAAELGIHTRIITNGFRLRRDRLRRLQASGLEDIMISVDGFEETHNSMRGHAEAFQNTIRTVQDAIGLGLSTRVSTVAYRDNAGEVVALMKFVGGLGVNIYSCFLGSPLGRGAVNRLGNVLNAEEWKELQKQAADAIQSDPVPMDVVFEQGFQYADGPQVDRSKIAGRGSGCNTLREDYDFLIVRADGNLYQCVFFVNEGPPIGNIVDTPLREALTAAQDFHFYEPFTVPQNACADCRHEQTCGRGCRGYAYLYSGDWLQTDPRCDAANHRTPQHFPLCPILKLNLRSGRFGGSTEQALELGDD